MPLDSNGIYQFTENEDVAPFSAVINLLGESVSDAVGPHVIDTGWQDLPLSMNTTTASGHPAQIRRIGHEVRVRGRLNRSSSGAGQLWAIVPGSVNGLAVRTERTAELPCHSDAGRVFTDPDGSIRHQNGTATFVWLNSSWWVD